MDLRLSAKLLLKPSDFQPSHPELKIVGVFNPGVIRFKNEVIALVRVAEEPIKIDNGYFYSPKIIIEEGKKKLVIDRFETGSPTDPRKSKVGDGTSRLSSISHLDIVHLDQTGLKIQSIRHNISLQPSTEYESYGIEDPRITQIGDEFYITYVSVSSLCGVTTSLLKTSDFVHFERMGMIFDQDTKDVVLFPHKRDNLYCAYLRPDSHPTYHRLTMMYAQSPDLLHWGNYRYLMDARPSGWDSYRIGAGCPPIKTEKGWLSIYHGVKYISDNMVGEYSAGALLTDSKEPTKIIARSEMPIFSPSKQFEIDELSGRVVFPTGIILHHQNQDKILVYYGASDTGIGVCEMQISDILNSLHG